MQKITCSTPSRICLFGEHQDYLGLEVIALAINLRFHATATPRQDTIVHIKFLDQLDNEPQEISVDFSKPIVYAHKRDYMNSIVNVLLKNGYPVKGCDLELKSDIPIGKGMCSSTTMIMVTLKTLLEVMDHPDKDDVERIAMLGFYAEVAEFGEPGGKMDHFTSALGNLVHLDFRYDDRVITDPIDFNVRGSFILFDSLQVKDTIKVLGNSKYPVQEALKMLAPDGITSIRDFVYHEENLKLLDKLDAFRRRKVEANIGNYKILKEAEALLKSGNVQPEKLGELLKAHQANLRDGLGISTEIIEKILNTAYENGALGGKINGSGGGGCCYVYALDDKVPQVVAAVEKMGYPAIVLKQDAGLRRDQ